MRQPSEPAFQAKSAVSLAAAPSPASFQYDVYPLEQGTAHVVVIPAGSGYEVRPAIVDQVDTLANFAQRSNAIVVINGGFFDPENLKSTSYVVQQGQVVADPQQNDRLMQNPN